MALSKRESKLAFFVGAVALLFALDMFVVEPYLALRAKLADLRTKDENEADAARRLSLREKKWKAQWAERKKNGLGTDPSDAERQLLGSLKDWANETGVVIASLRPEYVESKKTLREIAVTSSASGTNEAMVKFLFKLQTAPIPCRVTELQIGTRPDSEELTLQARISTLYLVPEKKDAKKDSGKKVAKE